MVEFVPSGLTGEGASRRREEGTIDVDGVEMAVTFVRVNPETSEVTFRVTLISTNFAGVLEGDKLSGTVTEKLSKGTFETRAIPK